MRRLLTLALLAATLLSAQAPMPARFEVASVKLSSPDAVGTRFSGPGERTFVATNASLRALVDIAYSVEDMQVMELPKWSASTRYDVMAKPEAEKGLNDEQMKQALQQLLAERLHMEVHHEIRQVRGYRLVVAKGQSKLQASKDGRVARIYLSETGLEAPNVTLERFASSLHLLLDGAPVVDGTGMTGSFNIKLTFARQQDTSTGLPSIFTALQEQLGLKLAGAKVPLDMVVIDRVERVPTPD